MTASARSYVPASRLDWASTEKNRYGTLSLVFAVLGWWPVGLVLGHRGRAAAKRGEANNRVVSTVALVVNYVEAVFFTAVVVLAIVAFDNAGRVTPASPGAGGTGFGEGSGGVVDPATGQASDGAVARSDAWGLAIGDCVAEIDEPGGDVREPQIVPCEEPHRGEVYAIAAIGGDGPALGDDADLAVEAVCQGAAFADYVGVRSYWDSGVFYDALYPTEAEWVAGRDDMVCLLTERGDPTTGSLRDAARAWNSGPR